MQQKRTTAHGLILGIVFPLLVLAGCAVHAKPPPTHDGAAHQVPAADGAQLNTQELERALAPAPVLTPPSAASSNVELALELAVLPLPQKLHLSASGPMQPPISPPILGQISEAEYWLVAHFTLPPETHIYWSNPGESGLPTQADFSSDELSLGVTEYPAPTQFVTPRGATSYGYSEEAFLVSRISLPALPTGTVEVRVRASWLSCAVVCKKDEATAQLSIPTSSWLQHSEHVPPWRSRLPGSEVLAGQWQGPQHWLWQALPGDRLKQFFPMTSLNLSDLPPVITVIDSGRQLSVQERRVDAQTTISGVVEIERGGAPRFLRASAVAQRRSH